MPKKATGSGSSQALREEAPTRNVRTTLRGHLWGTRFLCARLFGAEAAHFFRTGFPKQRQRTESPPQSVQWSEAALQN